ncbi:hypothetical protein [Candidatus Chlamydia corallus]|uniref:hypothetical protein n=1 Tax=Candidatus Chlamydia corallus TaxID=2038470 RepID=UPI000C2FEAFF|nr:hypothetical protein [Candidatus Chlamydia corallus]
MRTALSLLSLLMIFPLFGEESSPSPKNDDNNQQEIVEVQDIQVYRSYLQALQASRNEKKPLVIVVLYNPDNNFDPESCVELNQACNGVISVFSESIFSEVANFVLLAPSGGVPLIYPPVRDLMLDEIEAFKKLFEEESFPEGLSVVVICVTKEGPGNIIEVSPVPLTADEEVTEEGTPFLVECWEDEEQASADEKPTETEDK